MNQCSAIGFGADATVYAGYAQSAGDRLGAVDFVFENIGSNAAAIRLQTYTGNKTANPPSGWSPVDTDLFTVAAGGVLTKSYNLVSKRVAFFGSGDTKVNISAVIRNKADLRGAQIDIVAGGRQGWDFDLGFDKATLTKKWGAVGTVPSTSSNTDAGQGIIDPNKAGNW